MIIGIGSDLIDIRRVANVIERHGDRFLERIFTEEERAKAARRAKSEKMVVATYAKRFAAKEACSKALGTGIRRGVWWRAPLVAQLMGSVLDTALFFSIAFAGALALIAPHVDVAWANEPVPLLGRGPVLPLWVSLAAADFLVKLAIDFFALIPFRLIVARRRAMV